MDKILLNNLAFYGYHGVLKEETKLGQKFFIDIELFLDLEKAGNTDNLNFSVSYADVFSTVKKIVEGEPFKLIEALAESICSNVLSEYTLINEILVRVRKPEAPVPGVYDYFGVEIVRGRSGKGIS